jgi:hypothetical protein
MVAGTGIGDARHFCAGRLERLRRLDAGGGVVGADGDPAGRRAPESAGCESEDISFYQGPDQGTDDLVDVSAIKDELSSDPWAVTGDDWSLVVDFQYVPKILGDK